jgi:hypothetical protein
MTAESVNSDMFLLDAVDVNTPTPMPTPTPAAPAAKLRRVVSRKRHLHHDAADILGLGREPAATQVVDQEEVDDEGVVVIIPGAARAGGAAGPSSADDAGDVAADPATTSGVAHGGSAAPLLLQPHHGRESPSIGIGPPPPPPPVNGIMAELDVLLGVAGDEGPPTSVNGGSFNTAPPEYSAACPMGPGQI